MASQHNHTDSHTCCKLRNVLQSCNTAANLRPQHGTVGAGCYVPPALTASLLGHLLLEPALLSALTIWVIVMALHHTHSQGRRSAQLQRETQGTITPITHTREHGDTVEQSKRGLARLTAKRERLLQQHPRQLATLMPRAP